MKKFLFLVLLVMLATPLWAAADDFERGDVDQSGTVGIDDVTCLVDYLLSNEWPKGPYDEGYWVVINTIDGPEYIPLNESYDGSDGRYYAAIDVIYPIFLYACQFHYRINGVDYGPDRYITEPVVGKTYRNPVKPCRNNFILKVDDNELISYGFGLGIDEDNNYYAYFVKGGWAHP